MATGLARGASSRGKRIAFGDGLKIIWDHNSEPIFRGNPNICPPTMRSPSRTEWIHFYKGHRLYNTQGDGRWIWNYDFKARPGELFFTREEARFAEKVGKNFIVIEPNVPEWKTVAPNKQWPIERYDEVARKLHTEGWGLIQFNFKTGHRVPFARQIATPNVRLALAVLKRAALYIGAEGGLHHGAAALSVPAVVLFGGFVPPQVTGYDDHVNLTGGAEACGVYTPCQHCREALSRIGVDEVMAGVHQQVKRAA